MTAKKRGGRQNALERWLYYGGGAGAASTAAELRIGYLNAKHEARVCYLRWQLTQRREIAWDLRLRALREWLKWRATAILWPPYSSRCDDEEVADEQNREGERDGDHPNDRPGRLHSSTERTQ